MNNEQAHKFADDWIAAWNSHDIENILSHYADDFEMSSPIIIKAMNEPTGTLRGKEIISVYWTKALDSYPDLFFKKQSVLVGANSITVIYSGVRGLAAEMFIFNASGKVSEAYAHYDL